MTTIQNPNYEITISDALDNIAQHDADPSGTDGDDLARDCSKLIDLARDLRADVERLTAECNTWKRRSFMGLIDRIIPGPPDNAK